MAKLSFVVYAPPGFAQPCLVPSTRFDQMPFKRLHLKHGDVLTAEFKKPRNGKHHRLVFLLLTFAFESQERFSHIEALRRHLTMQTSFVIECLDRATGDLMRLPRSWSYDQMDQDEFETLHAEVTEVLLRDFYPTEDENWLKQSVHYQAFMDGVLSFFDLK